MARIRTVKPEFWTDDKIVLLPFETRLFFIGLWNFADDDGCFDDKPDQLRMQIFPANPDVSVELMLDQLSSLGMIELRVPDQCRPFWRITGFRNHQKISHPTPTKLPLDGSKVRRVPAEARRMVAKKYGCEPGESTTAECYYCGLPGRVIWQKLSNGRPAGWVWFELEIDHFESLAKGGENSEENLILACRSCNRSKGSMNGFDFSVSALENSGALRPEGKGREGNGKEGSRRSPKTSIPKNFEISDAVQRWAKKNNFDRLGDHFEYFVGKAKAKDYKYANWDQALMNAVRDDWAGLRKQSGNQSGEADQWLRGAV